VKYGKAAITREMVDSNPELKAQLKKIWDDHSRVPSLHKTPCDGIQGNTTPPQETPALG
jgi:hypothetical protein